MPNLQWSKKKNKNKQRWYFFTHHGYNCFLSGRNREYKMSINLCKGRASLLPHPWIVRIKSFILFNFMNYLCVLWLTLSVHCVKIRRSSACWSFFELQSLKCIDLSCCLQQQTCRRNLFPPIWDLGSRAGLNVEQLQQGYKAKGLLLKVL